jgi:hypothetical protein
VASARPGKAPPAAWRLRLHRRRQPGRFFAVENATGIEADLTIHVREIGSVAHQSAGFGKRAIEINRGQSVARRLG